MIDRGLPYIKTHLRQCFLTVFSIIYGVDNPTSKSVDLERIIIFAATATHGLNHINCSHLMYSSPCLIIVPFQIEGDPLFTQALRWRTQTHTVPVGPESHGQSRAHETRWVPVCVPGILPPNPPR